MGIQGLLPFLRDVQREVNLKDYKGCTVAVDAYCWLHKGAFACAEKLAVGEKTDQYVYYCMKFVNAMLSWDIKPVLVFDGCHLPSKKEVERTRRERRDAYRKKAAQFLREGKKSEARQCLERCIDITPQMALELMKACREKGVDCIVAPYEADSQLAYLNKIGVAQIIITEDSDLLLFGCERVLYKLDVNGNGIMIEKERLGEAASLKNSFCTFEKFRHMCILSGCDYLPSLRGIGLGNAAKIIKKAKNPDMTKVLRKLSTYLKNAPEVPQEYIDGFTQAENTFLYQVVFDPLQRRLAPLNPFPDGMNPKDLEYAGAYFCNGRAYQIALGNINIYNGERMDDYDPDTYKPPPQKVKMWEQNTGKRSGMLHRLSIWDKNFRAKSSVSTLKTEPSRTERLSTAGIEVQVKTIRIDNLRQNHGKRKREEEDLEKNDITLAEEYGYKKSQEKKRRSDDLLCLPETQKEEISTKENLYDSNVQELADVSNNKESSKIVGAEEVDAISPRRKNVFGTVLPKKEKFNINAAKPVVETHSRFFTKSTAPKLKKKRESVFDHFELQQGIEKDTATSSNSDPKADMTNTVSYVKDHKNSVQEKLNMNQEITTTLQTNTTVEMESNADSQEAKVRKSSFMWNKFSSSFSSRPKESDVKHVPLSSSQASLSQFKAVKVSEKSVNDAQMVNTWTLSQTVKVNLVYHSHNCCPVRQVILPQIGQRRQFLGKGTYHRKQKILLRF
ncbi:exonuclease 1-like [Lingula anatina]|uniref:Exonuclease 1 n=1 Tax=Lingula anatina TaxID=7574 RepID=A0A1S3I8U7_LINAN|nr:exonuclease 1-like [Lingula anatina]|eukprot:XP_013394291.1 exonuclease 1-like [Lingula anatina]